MTDLAAISLTPDTARRLTERIRLVAQNVADNVEKLRELVSEARESNVHEVLGYVSWTAYLKDVFGDEPLRLARDVRQELVAELSAQGLSTRAIAPIVGVSVGTIHTDRQVFSSEHVPPAPEPADHARSINYTTGEVTEPVTGVTEVTETHTVKTVTGLDGKTYKAAQPKKPNRRALTDTARDAGWELRKAVERLERIREDDRYSRNKEEVATQLRSHLTYAIESCQGTLDDLTQ